MNPWNLVGCYRRFGRTHYLHFYGICFTSQKTNKSIHATVFPNDKLYVIFTVYTGYVSMSSFNKRNAWESYMNCSWHFTGKNYTATCVHTKGSQYSHKNQNRISFLCLFLRWNSQNNHYSPAKVVSSSEYIIAAIGVKDNSPGMSCASFDNSKFNPLKKKRRLLYLKTQFVPRSKHFSSRL